MSETVEEAKSGDDKSIGLVLADFLPYRIVALARLISRRLSQAYEGENITIPEWRVLAVVSQADAMAARDVVALTPMDKMAVSRAVSSLETKGLVRRRPDAGDRRVYTLALSPEGRLLFNRIARLAKDYEARILAGFTDEEIASFKDALSRLQSSVETVGDAASK